MLLIGNDVVGRVPMRECIEAPRVRLWGDAHGRSDSRLRIGMFVPCDPEDGYYRWGSEGASDAFWRSGSSRTS